MNHLELVLNAKVAINKIYDDTSVSKKDTLESLKEIEEILETDIMVLEDELRYDE